MATLISSGKRRCDSRCYNAKHDRCKCICGGVNHGVGLKQAVKNTITIVKTVVSSEVKINVEKLERSVTGGR